MKWNEINSEKIILELIEESQKNPVLIFKHSTRCSISVFALNRLEKSWDEKAKDLKPYYLNLLAYRDISNAIAERFSVHHESPQVLVIKNKECVYDASHIEINYNELLEFV